MRARSIVRGGVSFTLVSSLCWLLAGTAGAAEEEEAAPSAEPSEPSAPPSKKPAWPTEGEPPPKAPPPVKPSSSVMLGEFAGWKVGLEGRVNTFFSYGWGNQVPANTPEGAPFVEGSGVGLNDNQTDTSGNFHTPRIRNGFVANLFALNVSRNLTDTTTMLAHFAMWADIETNLSVYIQPQTYMEESYLRLEGPWGQLTAGRQLALFSRGEVDIDFLYAHGNGLGWPCNFNFIYATCGQIGFGVMFPFFRPGFMYQTPSLGGLHFAVGAYDPVILAGKWERVIMPTLQGEIAFTTKFGSTGMFKLFVNGLWQKLGAKRDFMNIANKTVDQYGGAAGIRFEIGPLRLGLAGHYGKGLGFYYAQENSGAAAYNATDLTNPDDAGRDGSLRVFRGFYGQLALVFGQVMVATGAGASQLVPLSWETGAALPPLPKQNLGINAVFNYRISDNLIFDIDYFRAQFNWYATTFQQTVHTVNSGLTMTF
jgi:hypothetical protein